MLHVLLGPIVPNFCCLLRTRQWGAAGAGPQSLFSVYFYTMLKKLQIEMLPATILKTPQFVLREMMIHMFFSLKPVFTELTSGRSQTWALHVLGMHSTTVALKSMVMWAGRHWEFGPHLAVLGVIPGFVLREHFW